MQHNSMRFAAVALVTSLGLIAPGWLGGSTLADSSSSLDHNPQYVPTVLNCDLDGDGSYETKYELVATHEVGTWQDKDSTTVLRPRLRVDVLGEIYTALPGEEDEDPVGVDFVDEKPVYWFGEEPHDYSQGGGKPKGWQTVRCTQVVKYDYTATAEDVDPEVGLPFVYDFDMDKGARYEVTSTNLYDVTIGGNGPQAKAAGVERAHKARKQGKHRGKGKRGR